jgi:flagellar basal-body rod protein FlgB
MFSIDPVLDLLGRAVDLSALRHSVHAANVANANTEGYSRLELAADSAQRALVGADGGTSAVAEPRIVSVPGEVVRLDEEIASMAQNAVRYQALLGAFEKTMGLLRTAAREGKEG